MDRRTIIRKAKNKDNPYVMVSKKAVQDDRLSLKATGLLVMILSFPDDWKIYVEDLSKRKTDREFSIRNGLKELIETGYVEKVSYRNDKGQFVAHEYIIYETPVSTHRAHRKVNMTDTELSEMWKLRKESISEFWQEVDERQQRQAEKG